MTVAHLFHKYFLLIFQQTGHLFPTAFEPRYLNFLATFLSLMEIEAEDVMQNLEKS